MYQKIKDSLFFPKRLATSYQSKTIWFLIFLIVLSALPFILYTCVNGILTSSDIRNIKRTFYEEQPIEYRITNHQLVAYTNDTPNRYVVVVNGSMGIAFINNAEEEMVVSEQLVLVLENEGIYLCTPTLGGLNVKVTDYALLSDIDFKDASSLANDEFWEQIMTFVNNVIDDMKFLIYPSYFLGIILQMAISIVLGILMNTIIIVMFDRTPGLRFGEVFKNSTVAFFPYVIAVILAYAFNLALLQFIGNIISFVYAMIAHNEYRKIKYKEISR